MQALQSSLEPGDIVSTTSGLRATVVDASYEDTVDLEIADGVVTTWVRAAVREKIASDGARPTRTSRPPSSTEPAAPSLERTAPRATSPEQPSLVKDVETDGDREKDDSTNGTPRS